ncbi:ORC2-domain-containing protein [Pilatotrama ljubarskyi]|nr:ORC2-domain-containing protein [Pilatotrama ljubarskyi]
MLSEDAYTSYAEEEDEELEDWPGDPRTPSRRFHRRALTDDEDDDAAEYSSDEEHEELEEPTQGFATHTAFDAYFQLASKPARTSANVFSELVPPLTPEDAAAALSAHRDRARSTHPRLWEDEKLRAASYRRFRTELEEGFNLLFYGCGSKREFLNGFAGWLAEEGGHVVVANGFQPAFTFRDLLGAIERVPGVLGDEGESSSSGAVGGLDAQVQRIHTFFSRPSRPSASSSATPSSSRADPDGDLPHLYIIVHNIESAAFRAPKHRAALALLALAPRIHLCASFDHVVGTPLQWSLSEIFARKPSSLPEADGAARAERSGAHAAPKRGFAWLWHDLTTLAPYDFELAYADPTVLTGASALRGARASAAASSALAASSAGAAGRAGAGAVTETAARHILASVTQKAKKLFVLLGTKQLEVMDAPASATEAQAEGGTVVGDGEGEGAYDYDRLFAAARDNFVAQNDTALRALLGEFRDHGLVVTTASGGGEALWIPMRREALMKVVADLKAEGGPPELRGETYWAARPPPSSKFAADSRLSSFRDLSSARSRRKASGPGDFTTMSLFFYEFCWHEPTKSFRADVGRSSLIYGNKHGRCDGCHAKPGRGELFRRCGSCEFSMYRSVECQRADRGTHNIRKNATPEEVAQQEKFLKMRAVLVDYSDVHRISLQYIAEARWRGEDPKYIDEGCVDPGRAFSAGKGSFNPLSLFLGANTDETPKSAWEASQGYRERLATRYAQQPGYGGILTTFYRVNKHLTKIEFYPQCRTDAPFSCERSFEAEEDRARRHLRFVELGAFYGPNPDRAYESDEVFVVGYLKKSGARWKWWAMPTHRCDHPWHDENGYGRRLRPLFRRQRTSDGNTY